MNNKALNKEFGQMIRNKKQISKTGFTDSEEEENSKCTFIEKIIKIFC